MRYITICESPLGPLILVSGEERLHGLYIGMGQNCSSTGVVITTENHPVLRLTVSWLERYFSGQRPEPGELPLAPRGTDFQQRVWKLLENIPYGQTRTYGELARCLGERMSAQAVGQAVGRNPIAIILPCHRVLGAGGKLTGFSAGLPAKQWLLQHEGICFDAELSGLK